jgi:hypothetical protein
MKLKLRRQRKSVIAWSNCDIPARLFYDEVVGNDNYNILGEGTPEELEKAFFGILDELAEIDDNKHMVSAMRKTESIKMIQGQMFTISSALQLLFTLHSVMCKEDRNNLIDELNSQNVQPRIKMDKEGDLMEEIEKVQLGTLRSLKHALNLEKSTIQTDVRKAKKAFIKDLVSVQNVLGYALPDDVSLRKFIALKIAAKEKINAQNEQNKKIKRNGR